MSIKMKSSTEVGKMIESSFKSADDAGLVAHDTAIQCVLHIQAHGDVGLLERLVDGLEQRSMNMRGLRFWVGEFFPITQRAGKWQLLPTDGEAYAKLVERNALKMEPVNGPGDRLFWIDEANANPFWTLGSVKTDNGRNIARITTATLLGQVIGLQGRLDNAVKKGTFAGNEALADEFIEHMRASAEAFRKTHKADLRTETTLLDEAKAADKGNDNVSEAADDKAPSVVNAAGEPIIEVGGTVEDKAIEPEPEQQAAHG